MKNLLFTLKTFCLSALLFGVLTIQTMEKNYKEIQSKPNSVIEYNNIHHFLNLPNDILSEIFNYCHSHDTNEESALKQSMKNFIKMSGACKKFNNLLSDETIGLLCANYSQTTKDINLRNIVEWTGPVNYEHHYLPIYILIHAHAHVKDNKSLLRIAVHNNDSTLVEASFKHGAHPNLEPKLLFDIKDYRIASLFIKHGANLDITSKEFPNVLWKLAKNIVCSTNLIDLYLKHKVDPRKLHPEKNSCLLHKLAKQNPLLAIDIPDLMQRTAHILNIIPDMINHKNNKGDTPLDILYNRLERIGKYGAGPTLNKLIALFREHGALTTQDINVYMKVVGISVKLSSRPIEIICDGLKEASLFYTEEECIELFRSHIAKSNPSMIQMILGYLPSVIRSNLALFYFLTALDDQAPKMLLAHDLLRQNALHHACHSDRSDAVKIILDKASHNLKPLIFAQSNAGHTPLMIAANRNDIATLTALINAAGEKAKNYLYVKNKAGLTALDYAIKSESMDAIIFLEKMHRKYAKIECSLCLEEKKLANCHTMNHCNGDTGCEFNFCNNCLLEHIATQLHEGSTQGLTCPNITCGKKINEPDIRIITEQRKDLYERYLEIAFKEHVAGLPDIKHCQTPNCTFSFILEENAERFKIQCACNQTYCSHCLFNHDLHTTCDQAKEERILAQDPERAQQATEKWIAENTKPCPRCNTSIQKNGGCLYMFCKKCHHQFCWKCLQPHDHTMNHPCGIWENDAQLNQAQADLAQRLQRELNEQNDQ